MLDSIYEINALVSFFPTEGTCICLSKMVEYIFTETMKTPKMFKKTKDFIQNMERVNTIFINIIFKNNSSAEIEFNHVIHQTPDRFHIFLKQGMRVWTFTFSTRTTYILTLTHCTGNGQIKLLQWLPYKELVLTIKSDFRDT